MHAEAEALQRLAEATRELERYRKVYGDVSAFPADVQHLAAQLALKQAENETLRLSEEQHKEVSGFFGAGGGGVVLMRLCRRRNRYLRSWINCRARGRRWTGS